LAISAQSPVTNPAGFGETVPNPACLACPGSEWSNEMNITAADAQFATISLNQNGFCFQSTCFYSRYLYAHNFNFAIPIGATIDSIFVDILRKAATVNCIRDTIVQLEKVATITGSNLASTNFWPTTAATASYGQTDPLWSTTWLPSDINDAGTGVVLKIENATANPQQAGVDFIQMTIYYSTATGIHSATSSPSAITWINSISKNSAKVFLDGKTNCVSELYDATGNLLQSENYGQLSAGENEIEMQTSQLATGIYFWRIRIGDKFYTRKISVVSID